MGQLEEIISEGGENLGETNILLEDQYFFFSEFFFGWNFPNPADGKWL